MEYKIYKINNNRYWAIATDIKLFAIKRRRLMKRPVTYKECDIDTEGMYEPLEIFEDVEALEGRVDIKVDGELCRYVSFRNMLEEFAQDGSDIPLWGIEL
jgi:hypothetical protein